MKVFTKQKKTVQDELRGKSWGKHKMKSKMADLSITLNENGLKYLIKRQIVRFNENIKTYIQLYVVNKTHTLDSGIQAG